MGGWEVGCRRQQGGVFLPACLQLPAPAALLTIQESFLGLHGGADDSLPQVGQSPTSLGAMGEGEIRKVSVKCVSGWCGWAWGVDTQQ